jgi:hypothetical protein
LERLNEEKKRNNNKLILIDDVGNSNSLNNGESNTKLYVILPQIDKSSPKLASHKSPINGNTKNKHLDAQKDHVNSPREKSLHKEDSNKSNDFTFKRNPESINHASEISGVIHKKQPTDITNKVPKAEESIFDNSISFKSNKKSPYYFNDPKYSKLMEIKQKYNQGNQSKNINNDVYGGDIKYISDNNNISEEDYEIL